MPRLTSFDFPKEGRQPARTRCVALLLQYERLRAKRGGIIITCCQLSVIVMSLMRNQKIPKHAITVIDKDGLIHCPEQESWHVSEHVQGIVGQVSTTKVVPLHPWHRPRVHVYDVIRRLVTSLSSSSCDRRRQRNRRGRENS